MSKGSYIVIEGLPSETKTYVLKRIAEVLQARQQSIQRISGHEKNDTLTVQTLQQVSQDEQYEKTSLTSTLLAASTLSEELYTIDLLLEQGVTCLAEHSYLAMLVTEYYGRPAPENYEQITNLVYMSSQQVEPNLLLVLDVPTSGHNAQSATTTSEFERLRAGYLWEAKQRAIPVIFASADKEKVFNEIWQLIVPLVPGVSAAPRPASAVHSVSEVMDSRQRKTKSKAVKTADEPKTTERTAPDASDTTQVISSLQYLSLIHSGSDAIGQWPEYEKRDENNHYHFYIPSNLQGKIRSQYIKAMNKLFGNYATLLQKTTDFVRNSANISPEQQTDAWLAETLKQAREQVNLVLPVACTMSVPLGSVPKPNYNQALQTLANELLPPYFTGNVRPVQLTAYAPHNELDIAACLLYRYSDLPYRGLQSAVTNQAYQRKVDVLAAYFYDTEGATEAKVSLRQVMYDFDFVSSFEDILALCNTYALQQFEWQPLTPRLGYDTPELIEAAGLSDLYDDCFDTSLALYSAMQANNLQHEVQFATLQGHKQRWCATLNLHDVIRIVSDNHSQSALVHMAREVHQAVSEVHPLIAQYAVHIPRSQSQDLTLS